MSGMKFPVTKPYPRAVATAAKTESRDRRCECMVSVYRHTRGHTRRNLGATRCVHTNKTDTHIRHVTLMSAQVPNMGGDTWPQWILRVTDYEGLVRRCVSHGRQMNLWYAR